MTFLNRILFSDKASFFIHGLGSRLLTIFDFPLPRKTHPFIFHKVPHIMQLSCVSFVEFQQCEIRVTFLIFAL